MSYCKLLPSLITLELFNCDAIKYLDYLYDYYLENIKKGLVYKNKPIKCRYNPIYENREESFNHLTTKTNYTTKAREIDLRRSERLPWIKIGIMENHPVKCGSECFLIYTKMYKSKKRVHFLNKEDRYMIVLEERDDFFFLITAYYIENNHTLRKKIKEYEKFINTDL